MYSIFFFQDMFLPLFQNVFFNCRRICQDSRVHGANMGPTWVLSAPDEPHVSPMNLAIRARLVCGYKNALPLMCLVFASHSLRSKMSMKRMVILALTMGDKRWQALMWMLTAFWTLWKSRPGVLFTFVGGSLDAVDNQGLIATVDLYV